MSVRRTTGGVVALLLLGLLVSPAWAQTVEPYEIDFGTVNVGEESIPMLFTVSTNVPITIDPPQITGAGKDAFSVDVSGLVWLPGGSKQYWVTFTPPEARVEPYYATLTLTYTTDMGSPGGMGSTGGTLSVYLSGYGEGGTTPEEMIVALIEDFDEWVEEDGLLEGTGRGQFKKPRHKVMRLRVVGLMLLSAKRLIYTGRYDLAYEQLDSILKHADGLSRPWDFVTGSAREEFATRLGELMLVLEGY